MNASLFSATKKTRKRQVVIIGAGISGLTIGHELQKVSSDFDVQILEAKDRLGGRTFTVERKPFAVDLGASWIHGIKRNPLYALAQKLKLNFFITDDIKKPLTYLDSDHILPQRERNELDSVFENFKNASDDNDKLGTDISLAAAYLKFLHLKHPKFTDVDNNKLRHILVSEVENDFGTEAEHISYKYWDSGMDYGNVNALLKDGMISLVEHLAAGSHVELNQKVIAVDWQNPDQIIIKTNQKTYIADQVVITASLGALKKKQIEFLPALPAWKTEAINKIGFGQFSKVFLFYKTAFWPNKYKWIENIPANPHSWPMFLNLHYFLEDAVLVALHVGEEARRIDALSDEQIKDEVTLKLKKIWGSRVTRPVRIYKSNWSQDPENYGAYSYPALGSCPGDYDLVGKAVDDRIYFAGEATDSTMTSTVNAAYLSGIRVAKAIVKSRDTRRD